MYCYGNYGGEPGRCLAGWMDGIDENIIIGTWYMNTYNVMGSCHL